MLQACALVGIIPDLNLDMYSLQRQEAGFQALLRAVADVLLKHVDADTVAHCARTLVHCTHHGPQAIQVTYTGEATSSKICSSPLENSRLQNTVLPQQSAVVVFLTMPSLQRHVHFSMCPKPFLGSHQLPAG